MSNEDDITKVAIKEFINSQDNSKHTKISIPVNKESLTGFFSRSSRIINRKLSRQVNSEVIANIKGVGELREITVIADSAINVQIVIDGNNLLNGISTWTDLNSITSYTGFITAKVDGLNYVFSVNKLRFSDYCFIQVYFDSDATISSVFGIYDLYGFTPSKECIR